jgi:hypothetical protein
VSLILYILIITWGTEVPLWTFNRVVDENHSVAVIAVVSPGADLTGRLTLVLLEPPTGADHGCRRTFRAVVAHAAEKGVVRQLTLGAIVSSAAVP